ncbi:MAG: flavin prenyltransferase UbiX [Deltaproteobacteria bacterium]
MALYVVALTGASGAIYGLRLAGELIGRGNDVDLIISPSGFLILKEELGLDIKGGSVAAGLKSYLEAAHGKGGKQALEGRLDFFPSDDLMAACASGSARVKAMAVCPCSMGTLARIASGASSNLIERAADCALKEKRTLVVVPRETPLNSIHLENMLRLSRAGAAIVPAMPAFYNHPETIDDMVDFMAGKVLDVLGVENSLYKRWGK